MDVTRLAMLVALGIATLGGPCRAACNAIPTPRDQLTGGPNPNDAAVALTAAVLEEEGRHGGLVPYKGALGRIDRVLLSAEREGPVRVAVDGHCVAGTGPRPLVVEDADDVEGLVAAAISLGGAGAPSVTVLTRGARVPCAALVAGKEGEGGAGAVRCEKDGPDRHDDHASVLELDFPTGPTRGGPARIAVFRAATPAGARALLARLATTPCERLCGEAVAEDLAVCVDTLYVPVALADARIQYAPDLVKCQITETPSPIPWNDFAKLCEPDAAWPDLPACQGVSEALALWEDGCHGVYVPIDWTNIRQGADPDPVDRLVRGQSAISRREQVKGGRAWVPGREYVGTLGEADVGSGTTFATDPRKAAIDVWYPSKEEFGLQGVVDKNRSIIHVVPRLAASFMCDDSSSSGGALGACMRVATQPVLDITRCACTDRYDADCTCHTLAAPKLFECRQSGMPCTRHAHCNRQPNDTCSAQPRCRREGQVWKEPGPPPGGPCWSDDDCKSDASRPQCGVLLFNAREKREPGQSVVRVDKTIVPTAARKQRGACRKTAGPGRKPCSNDAGGDPACGPADGDCIGYLLEAGGKK